jgi:hypothetical protein
VRRGLAGLALTLIIVTGCGGGPSGSAKRLQVQASRICGAANQRAARIRPPKLGPGDRTFLVRGIGVLAPELTQLRTLRVPGEDRSVYGAAVSTMAAEIGVLRRGVAALDRGQDPALVYAALERRLRPLEARADRAWGALQIPACVSR